MVRVLFSFVLCLLAWASAGILSAATLHVYLLTGQSNSLGAVKGSPASGELLQRYASQQLLWNGNMMRDTGECFEKNPAWVAVAPQLPAYSGGLCMGPEYGFASMQERLGFQTKGGDAVAIIKASLDGGGNTYWVKGRPAYESLLRTSLAALREAGKMKDYEKMQLEGLLYLQGESDSGEEVKLAQDRLMGFVQNLRKDLKKELKKDGPRVEGPRLVVLGQPANWHGRDKETDGKTTATELQALAERQKGFGWVYTRDLTKITSGDAMGVHYDGKSQLTIGARFAYAMALLQGRSVGAVRGQTPDVSLHEPSAWWGGKLPGQRVAVWDISSARGVQRLAAPLALEGIRVEDPFDEAVQVEAVKGKKPPVLSLGAGGVELRGAGLELRVPVKLAAEQTWIVPEGKKLALGGDSGRTRLLGRGPLLVKGGGACLFRGVVMEGTQVRLQGEGSSLMLEDGELRAGSRLAGEPVLLRGKSKVSFSEEEWTEEPGEPAAFRTEKLPGGSQVQGVCVLNPGEALWRRLQEAGQREYLLHFRDEGSASQQKPVDFSGVTEFLLSGSEQGKGEVSAAGPGVLRVKLLP